MNFDLKVVPFSRYGSYIAFSHLEETGERQDGLHMRTVHGCGFHAGVLHVIFRVELLRGGTSVSFKEIASPTALRLETEGGYAEICIAEPKLVRIRGVGVGLRLTMDTGMFDNAIPAGNQRWQVISFASGTKYMLTPIKGHLAMDAPWNVDKSDYIVADFLPDPDTGVFECAIEEFISVWQKRDYNESFDTCLNMVKEEYQAWLEKMP
nr:hypothetical protein [Anaerolineae bacterium]NIN93496.1 hypothetical protein [Anaerolineae bacterium]NIQ76570.1 hypothetical protein [Anaerolineae bacterium]